MKDLTERNNIMSEILAPLGKEKREIMRRMLESVDTNKLHTEYKKFLPTVLGNSLSISEKIKLLTEATDEDTVLPEGKRVVDGNRKVIMNEETEGHTEIAELKRLSRGSF